MKADGFPKCWFCDFIAKDYSEMELHHRSKHPQDMPKEVKEDLLQTMEILIPFTKYTKLMLDKIISSNQNDDKKTLKAKFLFNCGVMFDDYWTDLKDIKK